MQAWSWKTVGKILGFTGVSFAAIVVGSHIGDALARELGPVLRLRRLVRAGRGVRS